MNQFKADYVEAWTLFWSAFHEVTLGEGCALASIVLLCLGVSVVFALFVAVIGGAQ